MRILVCSEHPGAAHWVSLMMTQQSSDHTVDVLTELDEVMSRVAKADFDVCLVGFNTSAWCDQLSRQIHAQPNSDIKCVLGVSRLTSEAILLALKFRAHAILELGLSVEGIVQQLEAVISGDVDLARDNSIEDIHRLCGPKSILRHCRDDLDLRILAELLEGNSNESIADVCNVAIQTVRNRLVRLMSEAGVDNRTQLATQLVRE